MLSPLLALTMFLAGKVILLEVLKNSSLCQLEDKRLVMAEVLVQARACRAAGIIFFLCATSGKDVSDGGGGGGGGSGDNGLEVVTAVVVMEVVVAFVPNSLNVKLICQQFKLPGKL